MLIQSLRMTALGAFMLGVSAVASAGVVAGTYDGSADGKLSRVTASVTLDAEGRLSDIKLDVSGETPALGGAAASRMAPEMVRTQSVAVDGVSGATVTSEAIRTVLAKRLRWAALPRQEWRQKWFVRKVSPSTGCRARQ